MKEERFFLTMESPLGTLVLIASQNSLKEIRFEKQKYFDGSEGLIEKKDYPVLLLIKSWLEAYFMGQKPDPSVIRIAPEGSAFQLLVWDELKKIPYGQLTTYGAIADAVAEKMNVKKMSAQAVGGAIGRNPLGILVPCHRVIGKNGKLTGYAGGLEKKRFLLELEGHSGLKIH